MLERVLSLRRSALYADDAVADKVGDDARPQRMEGPEEPALILLLLPK
ncbi:uncharacterized protein G2W53_033926 [Senna tora]|uniref:Uncharacterized protein n=1 Tax=Senna tora TaxID=362788 RepID=A0A834SZG5_9FABA|nr:uncharacterized protein G2W53_033926 [Senna tora]